MALPRCPTEQLPSSHFLVSGGSILFSSTHAPLRICLIYHHARGEWLLPKGRKDHGESVPATAVRETFEETGYPCELLPLDLITRAPAAGAQTEDAAVTVGGSGEPFMVTLRRTKDGGIQILSWFATVCTAGADKVVGGVPELQTEVEDYESAWMRRCGWRRFRLIGMLLRGLSSSFGRRTQRHRTLSDLSRVTVNCNFARSLEIILR